jgi:hypothetical protein
MLGPKIGPLFYGSPPPATFNDIPGDQFITVTQPAPFGSQLAVVPEPASIVLIVAMLVAAAGSRQDYV